MTTRYINFNGLLRAANLLVGALLAYSLLRADTLDPSDYLDRGTLALGLVLVLQTHCALWIERRRRDPFFLLLACWMILYFEFRIYTLAMLPFSLVFDRYPYDASDSNFALLFILVGNLCIYAGLYSVRFRDNLRVDIGRMRARAPAGVVVLLIVAIVFAYFRGTFWTEDNVPRALNFLAIFLGPEMVILMAVVYLLLFHRSLPRAFALAIGGLIFLDICAHTLWGSRSAIMGFAQFFLLAALAVLGTIRFKRRSVLLGALALPAAAALLVATFTISTYNRAARVGAATLDVSQSLAFAREAGAGITDSPLVDLLLPPIAARAGYFDFSAEVMAHREHYQPVFNLAAYGRSLIDNILTPGFDVFDQPKTSNAMRFIYMEAGPPSKAAVSLAYHSDQFGLYGEMYALFGYFSLFLLFLGAVGFKSLYVKLRNPNPFRLAAMRAIVLLCFIRLIDSFGIDWVVGEMIPYVAAVFIFSFLFTIRRVHAPLVPADPYHLIRATQRV